MEDACHCITIKAIKAYGEKKLAINNASNIITTQRNLIKRLQKGRGVSIFLPAETSSQSAPS